MFTKTFLFVLLATLSMSLAKDDQHELVNQILSTGTVLTKEFSKLVADSPDKLSVDFNNLYKKLEVDAKAEQAKSFLQTQFKKAAESYNESLKKTDAMSQENLKKTIDIIKKEDPILGEKLYKFYEKTCEMDKISEDIVKYILDVDKITGALDKYRSSISPFIHKATEGIKKFETFVVEHIPKKDK
ncbi:uncharacterized protein LOC112692747 isoform X2 [Sipha flava]|uniref:Uncharacterized protein LOC112692747 isoform X2 n=1 Tax=Sipha flava TaxID=143950 RepID=A0A8B8GK44_9HEMI|nr:uncharacterized protein LOC112692747 isoform X2 [Sipha flava]